MVYGRICFWIWLTVRVFFSGALLISYVVCTSLKLDTLSEGFGHSLHHTLFTLLFYIARSNPMFFRYNVAIKCATITPGRFHS